MIHHLAARGSRTLYRKPFPLAGSALRPKGLSEGPLRPSLALLWEVALSGVRGPP